MEKQQYKKLSIEFPAEDYVFLKMACAKQQVSIKDFVTQAVNARIDAFEAELDAIALEKTLKEENIESAISWEEAKKDLGWDKL